MYKVLIVEDEMMIRKGLQYSFDWLGSDCVVVGDAGNGVEGSEKIRQLRPDIVVTDVGMPIKNGIEMLEETLEEYGYSAIILSVFDEFHYAKRAMHMGVVEYLIKPLEYDQLTMALERAKEQCRIRQHFHESVNRTEQVMDQTVLDFQLVIPDNIKSRRVKSMLEYISENYMKKISIDDLVEPLRTSATYLNQKFKEETGFTFNDFLNRYRIQRSIQLLKEDDYKIYNIATETGFKDYKYFINVFKKYTGILPSKFREYHYGKSEDTIEGE